MSAADVGPVAPEDLRCWYRNLSPSSTAPPPPPLICCSHGSPSFGVHTNESYLDALVNSSLRMASKVLPVEVQCVGLRMLQHMVYFRRKELMNTRFADLSKVLVGSLDDLVLKDIKTVSDDSICSTANPKENNKHKRCLLVALAVNIDLRSRATKERNTMIGNVRGREGDLTLLSNVTNISEGNFYGSGGICEYCRSLYESYECAPFMIYPDNIGDIGSIINSCKESVEVAEPAMLVNFEMMLSHQEKGSLLLMEHNIISQAFFTLITYSGVHRYAGLINCLLSLLNNIWTSPEWRTKYLHHGLGVTCLLSNSQFLKMVHYMVRLFEVVLRGNYVDTTFARLVLPLILELLQLVHGLWYPPIACNLSPDLERAKYQNPCFSTKDKEGSREMGTGELIEGIRECGYNVIGLCASMDGAFFGLLNKSVCDALSKYLKSLEFRHLGKLINLTVIPLVKNCPPLFCKDWVDNFLGQLLRHCEDILHRAWYQLLYDGCTGASYYFGKLSGSEGEIKILERDILLEFTREVSALLEAVALTEQNRALSLEDGTQNMKLPSLLKYLVFTDCFGEFRMGLLGYFVDDASTAKVIPFCHALISLALDSNNARLRIFLLENLLPCAIQSLDDKLPCAIQSLKCELSSCTSDNASKGLLALCHELYAYMLNCGYVQGQAVSVGDKNSNGFKNSFEVWLERHKEDFRTKANQTAARNVSFGHRWKWELEDECQRYLCEYIDMLLEVDATYKFAEVAYLEKEVLLEKLRPEFKDKYGINSVTHPYIHTISSSIRPRKFSSMATVVRKGIICNLARQLINLKPYIKGSDRPCDVIYRLKRTSEVPAEFSKYVTPAVNLLHSVLIVWEPRFHPMIREAQMNKLSAIVDGLRTECEEPLVPIVGDFPNHLQPYALDIIQAKLNEPKYVSAKQQISLHAQFDEYLDSGDLDNDILWSMTSKVDFVKFISTKLSSRFRTLEHSLLKLSFERRAEIVHLQADVCTYVNCLQDLLKNESLKVQAKCLISELEAEGFFDVDSNRVNWGKSPFSKLVDKFNSEFLSRSSLPKHYAIRGLIDCRAILLMKDISLDEAFKKVVVDIQNSFTGHLRKYWKDTRHYQHEYYDIIRDPLRQVNWCSRTQSSS